VPATSRVVTDPRPACGGAKLRAQFVLLCRFPLSHSVLAYRVNTPGGMHEADKLYPSPAPASHYFTPSGRCPRSLHSGKHNLKYINYVGCNLPFTPPSSSQPDNIMHILHDDLLPLYNTLREVATIGGETVCLCYNSQEQTSSAYCMHNCNRV